MFWRKSKPSNPTSQATSRWVRAGQIYILPTAFGGIFLGGAFLMLLIGASYQNNLVNLLGFFMLAILFTAMLTTHANISGLELVKVESVHGFAGEELPVAILIRNTSRSIKLNCDFSIRGLNKLAQYDARLAIKPGGDARLLASFSAPTRGQHKLAVFVLSSIAPMGLFRAWTYRRSDAIAMVYPRRRGDRPWRTAAANGALNQSLNRSVGAEDFKDHRPYSAGDSLRRVDWRIYARNRQVLVKEYDEPTGHGLHFDYAALAGLDHEARLEQIASWIDQAQKQGQPFQLSLPTVRLGPHVGLAFAHRAWSELAKSQQPGAA